MSIPGDLDSPTNAPLVKAPAIFILADKDEVVPMPYKQQVVDAYAGPKKIITLPDSGHNDPIHGPAVQEFREALDWLLSSPQK